MSTLAHLLPVRPVLPLEELESLVRAHVPEIGVEKGTWALHAHIVRLAYLCGIHPFAVEFRIDQVPKEHPLIPADGRLLRECRDGDMVSRLVAGDGWSAVVQRRANGSTWAMVVAGTSADATFIADEVKSWQAPRTDVPSGVVPACFTFFAGNYVERSVRTIDAPTWSEIATSYPDPARRSLAQLVEFDSMNLPQGRIVLLHGLPGTGKTTFLRSLASSWLPWCRLEYILDSDVMFANPGYLFGAVLRPDDDADDDEAREGTPLWRMLVIEDCDELLHADAKARSGQALSRLLNLADGAVGQGQRLIICRTTNEPIHRLHPALIRPGRCRAAIEVGRFPAAESRAWLVVRGVPDDVAVRSVPREGLTLAELHAIVRGDFDVSVGRVSDMPGQYL